MYTYVNYVYNRNSVCVREREGVFLAGLRKSIADGAQTQTATEMSSFCTSNQMQPQLHTLTHTRSHTPTQRVWVYLLRICNYIRHHSDLSLLSRSAYRCRVNRKHIQGLYTYYDYFICR